MDEPRAVSASISAIDAEPPQPLNLPDGLIGYSDRCEQHGYAHCVWCTDGPGIDIPGVGRVPAATVPGTPYVAGEIPDHLRRFLDQEERKSLLGKLFVSAGRLALSRIHAVWPSKRNQCLECGNLANAEDVIAHRNCRAGEVLDVIDRLDRLDLEELQSVNPIDGKEVAEVLPEHRAPVVDSAAGIPVSVIVSVGVLNSAFRLLEMYRQSVLSRSAIGADPAATVPALDSVLADLRKAKGGAA